MIVTTRCGREPRLDLACLVCGDLARCYPGQVHEIDRDIKRALVVGGLVVAAILALCWAA